VFVTVSHFRSSIVFEGKAGAVKKFYSIDTLWLFLSKQMALMKFKVIITFSFTSNRYGF
jgi:hypothetical protein